MSVGNDKILNYYDCIFIGDKSQNNYQIRLNKDSTDYFRDIITDIFLRIDSQLTSPAFVDSFLNHHFNFCKEDKKEFIFYLEERIKFISRFVFSNERLFQSSIRTELFTDWINKKRKEVSENNSFETSNNQDREFSAKQWAIIFHYAYEYKGLDFSKSKIEAIKKFIVNYKATTTFNSIKNDEIDINNQIKGYNINTNLLESVINYVEKTFGVNIAEAIEEDIKTILDEQSR